MRQDCYPLEIERVDEGSAAYEQGVPQNSVIVRVNGQWLLKADGKGVRERVRKMLKERPLTFDVVLRDAAGPRPLAGGHPPGAQRLAKGGHPAVPEEAPGAGADAAAGQALTSAGGAVARAASVGGTLKELISALPVEEQKIVACVLRKLEEERPKDYHCVHAVLRELAGDARRNSQK